MPQVLLRPVRGRGKRPDWPAIAKEIEKTLDIETKPMLIEYHERIVNEWSGDKPGFKARKRVSRTEIVVSVYPTGGEGKDKWIWLTQGTGLYGPKRTKYPIVPRRASVLAFPSIYIPRTKPGSGGQYKGPGKSSGPTVLAKRVMHPGIKPRLFAEAIARWARPKFIKQMEAAVRRGIKKGRGK